MVKASSETDSGYELLKRAQKRKRPLKKRSVSKEVTAIGMGSGRSRQSEEKKSSQSRSDRSPGSSQDISTSKSKRSQKQGRSRSMIRMEAPSLPKEDSSSMIEEMYIWEMKRVLMTIHQNKEEMVHQIKIVAK